MKRLETIDRLLQRLAAATRWFPPLLARITLAAVFVPTGWGKLSDLDKPTQFFTELGIPFPHANAVLVGASELICGSLLLVGLATRFAAAPLIVSMAVAIATAKRNAIEGVLDVFGFEEFLYVVLLVWLIVAGAGALSLDKLVRRWAGLDQRPPGGAPSGG
jgi:putative oxidoreductase